MVSASNDSVIAVASRDAKETGKEKGREKKTSSVRPFASLEINSSINSLLL